ncbi:excalibur calcium-binding domain-containing protein [Mesorhizobium sp. M1365]|uniref:excalibur calcium-binding domain-containing protein n=1 Tax=Mesorhizobium sp. M1365 TaxID=2957090 RepID=UPI003337AC63
MLVSVWLSATSITHSVSAPPNEQIAQSWGCSPRLTCGKIRSCEEAMWYLQNCPWGGNLDRDGDGAPCENLCGSNN